MFYQGQLRNFTLAHVQDFISHRHAKAFQVGLFKFITVLSQENLCFTDRLGLPCKRFHELIEDSSMPE